MRDVYDLLRDIALKATEVVLTITVIGRVYDCASTWACFEFDVQLAVFRVPLASA